MFGRLVSSTPSRWACCTASRRAATRPARGSGTCGEVRDEAAQRELVTRRPQTADNADGAAGQHRASALRLPRKNVRHVHFHVRHGHRGKCITERETGMAVRAGVDDGALRVPAQALYTVNEFPFAVTLGKFHINAQLRGDTAQAPFDVVERIVSVHLGLAGTEEIEVGPVQHGDAHYFFSPSSHAWNSSRSSSPGFGSAGGVALPCGSGDVSSGFRAKNSSNDTSGIDADGSGAAPGSSRNTCSRENDSPPGVVPGEAACVTSAR